MYFDEIDRFLVSLKDRELKKDDEDIIDEILDLLILGYLDGSEEAARELGVEVEPSVSDMMEVIEKPTAGKTFRERVKDYLNDDMGKTTGTPQEAIARVVDTEATRVYNEAKFETATDNGAVEKTWHTMRDDRVRDSHVILDGITVPIDAYFYTEGDKALAPCGFETAEENVGCRCWLTFK